MKMKNKILIIGLLFIILFLSGCVELSEIEEKATSKLSEIKEKTEIGLSENHGVDQGITINEFFGKNITKYSEKIISGKIECTSGECPEVNFVLDTKEKDCYFCDVYKIRGDDFSFHYGGGGGFDSFFGCTKKWDGPFVGIGGFKVLEKTENILRIQGNTEMRISQKSKICDRTRDPECDDTTYGTCSEEDYSYKSIRTIEMVFKP